jgi:hypothetical protein
VLSAPTIQGLTGKEGNKLLERLTGEVTDLSEYCVDYEARGDSWRLVLDGIDRLGVTAIARRSRVHRRTIERLRTGTAPHRGTQARIVRAVADEAAERLGTSALAEPYAVARPVARNQAERLLMRVRTAAARYTTQVV